MKNLIKVFFVLIIILFTHNIFAQVIINEIAWMGNSNSSSDEWIELYNLGGSDIDLTNWTLEATDDSPSITLSGFLPSFNFFLLERTDDSSAPTISADFIYTGALSNDGEHLILKNDLGEIINQIDASTGWLAGDNATKETMQWDGAVWQTGEATPRATNIGSSSNHGGESGGSSSKELIIIDENIPVFSLPTKMSTKIIAPESMIAEAPYIFSSKTLNSGGEILIKGKYTWNFGNGEIREDQENKDFEYTYSHPGEYVVILEYRKNFYNLNPDVTDRIVIEVIPADLSISNVFEDGSIELFNESDNEINIGKWSLKSNDNYFNIPKNTFILSGKKLVFSPSVTGFTNIALNQMALIYPNQKIASDYKKEPEPKKIPQKIVYENSVAKTFVQEEIDQIKEENNILVENKTNLDSNLSEIPLEASIIKTLPENRVNNKKSNSYIWFLVLIGLVSLAVLSIFFIRNSGKRTNNFDSFKIID
ncbi:hypothetical protein A2995_00690 [Candidatus Nomurabacteria bacterium RIFCSPLOWO2_01_FULL_33_24]|uniref:PKD domain-containing protein n=1 Tax=Candidatus Nomurabacteria bacterium RIFCSPLOWO2_01_FULL_33_24 TaxID=1801765 RepID=A0A1F6X0W1_9BACT|nr:MAG: hypothetical protein A2995_00690 [Candidatus Nomurabacteria bacterium RIFCSPLOWO2_01_FULL_33_24]